ncbi:hypothetical protein AF72_03225 [Xylella taiwanensis]|uniref:Uncharacterized protein n=1 Tax=Xylella taiwanensis TaxID=1444770 RepID=Z9JL60_9GAMM|nr:hypothetical protein AF72_03225 [Xylella taiwanensis]
METIVQEVLTLKEHRIVYTTTAFTSAVKMKAIDNVRGQRR